MPLVNRTQAFLGAEADWAAVRLRLDDVQGLWGGRRVLVAGTGQVAVQVVGRGLFEKRYRLALSRAEVRRLIQSFVEADFLTIDIEARPGLPDEARPEIALSNAAGQRRAAAKWAGQSHARFDRLYAELLRLEKQAAGQTPVYAGPFQGDYMPEGF